MMLYIGTNLKMYKNIEETVSYLKELQDKTLTISKDEIYLFVIPSFTSLESARKCINKKNIKLGAQNMHWEEQGQFTGEISPLMLKELDLDIIEIGHSERRHVFLENDNILNKKVLAALAHGFSALLCVGETKIQKDYRLNEEILSIQLKTGLKDVSISSLDRLLIAYEPVWAIGTQGTPASPKYVDMIHGFIKKMLCEQFGDKGKGIPVLYGGSVNPQNASSFIMQDTVDGLFIGRSAWDADIFYQLIMQILPIWKNKQEGLVKCYEI